MDSQTSLLHPAFPIFNHLLMRDNKLARSLVVVTCYSSVFLPSICLQPPVFLFCSLPELSKRREEEVAEEAEYEEADDPVDRVDVDDDHVHVKAPAPGVILKVHGVQAVASSVGELSSGNGTGLPLKAWIG